MGSAPEGAESAIFTPLKIGNGKITLKHRVVLAPLTRNRGTPLNGSTIPTKYSENIWVHDDLGVEYYSQRATEGGLIISEGIPPSLESNGFPGVPGLWLPEVSKALSTIGRVRLTGYSKLNPGKRLLMRFTQKAGLSTPSYGLLVVRP